VPSLKWLEPRATPSNCWPGWPFVVNAAPTINVTGTSSFVNLVTGNLIWTGYFSGGGDTAILTVTCTDFGAVGCNCDQDQTGYVVSRLRIHRVSSTQIGIIGPTVGSVGGLAVVGGATVVGIAGLYYGLRRLRAIKKLDNDPFEEAGFAGATSNPTFEGTSMETVNPAFEGTS